MKCGKSAVLIDDADDDRTAVAGGWRRGSRTGRRCRLGGASARITGPRKKRALPGVGAPQREGQLVELATAVDRIRVGAGCRGVRGGRPRRRGAGAGVSGLQATADGEVGLSALGEGGAGVADLDLARAVRELPAEPRAAAVVPAGAAAGCGGGDR